MGISREARLGSLVAAGGVIWTAHLATQNFSSLNNILLPSGPLEICGLGILVWLHAKWRSSVRVR